MSARFSTFCLPNTASLSPPIIPTVPKEAARTLKTFRPVAPAWTQEEKRCLWEYALESVGKVGVPWKETENEIRNPIPGRSLMDCQLYYQIHYRELRDLFENQYVSDDLRRKPKKYSCRYRVAFLRTRKRLKNSYFRQLQNVAKTHGRR